SLLQQVGGKYLGINFTLSDRPTDWLLKLGRYQGALPGRVALDLHGYWVFRADGVNQCWQAVNGGGAGLAYWNSDGRAIGIPENWELFTFEQVSRDSNTVRIKNVGSDYYFGLVGDSFSCNERQANATLFVVQFPP